MNDVDSDDVAFYLWKRFINGHIVEMSGVSCDGIVQMLIVYSKRCSVIVRFSASSVQATLPN